MFPRIFIFIILYDSGYTTKDGKPTNFVATINVFSLTVSSPMLSFYCVKLSKVVCG